MKPRNQEVAAAELDAVPQKVCRDRTIHSKNIDKMLNCRGQDEMDDIGGVITCCIRSSPGATIITKSCLLLPCLRVMLNTGVSERSLLEVHGFSLIPFWSELNYFAS